MQPDDAPDGPLASTPPVDVEALVRDGRHLEAAAELRRRGDLGRAQVLYEQLWDFRAAAEVARERGDRPELLRLLVAARAPHEVAHVVRELEAAAPGEQDRAAQALEAARLFAEAAGLRERLGQLDQAHALYRRAALPLEAARIDESLGRLREAGIACERLLAEEPDGPDAARARVLLGRVLVGFGRHEEAARHLQAAAGLPTEPALADEARRQLVAALAGLGYRGAACVVLDRLRVGTPDLPPLEPFLERLRASTAARLGGRYRVERLLGAGAAGRVYLAQDELSGRAVAVKVVPPPGDARLRVAWERFVREARVVSRLRHPNLVAVVAFHEAEGLLALEYLPGGSLADRLPGPLSLAAVRALLLEVAQGLETAHAEGVVHRDIKPSNVFFSASGEAKLGDFGAAHLSDLGATQTAGFVGTLAYMAPEQITGAAPSFATDVYALGVTAFQAITGRLPFLGPDLIAQHLGEAPPRPSSLRGGLPPAWDELLLRAMAKDPDARFESLEALRRAAAALPDGAPQLEPEPARAAARPAEPAGPRERPRYEIAGPAERGVLHATDTGLGRTVLLERLGPEEARARLPWLRAIAAAGGPHVQRLLRLEPLEHGGLQAVYEQVAGPPATSLTTGERDRLARALAPLHAAGLAHGAVTDHLIREEGHAVLLVAGHAPRGAPEADRAALDRLVKA